jgi:predicted phosphodiesterase
MRIGLVSDVHANRPALEAVLDDMPAVDEVVCVGDVVGYNPWPAACVERIRSVAAATVRGNHDRTVETPERYRANRMAEAGLEHAKRALSDDQLAWLRSLPRATRFGGGDFLLVHSHPDPAREDAYVYPREFETLAPAIEAVEAADDGDGGPLTGAVLGHTHVQGAEWVDDRLVINPGSVGQPRDGDPDAAYAVLETTEPAVDLRRVSYDVDQVIEAVERAGLPSRTGERLTSGE